MNEKQTNSSNPLKGDIQFISSQSPVIKDGSYSVTITQKLSVNDQDVSPTPVTQAFQISGPRITLNPQKIKSVFPPAGSSGDRANVLPHIFIQTPSLPWQRMVYSGADALTPWLALLVFDADHAPAPAVLPASDLAKASDSSPFWPGMSDNADSTVQVTVIDVDYSILNTIVPGYSDLQYLSHIRKTEQGDQDSIFSVVVANRFPRAKGKSVVHLVSLENRYNKSGFDFPAGIQGSDTIRLVSLYHWSFSSLSPDFDFAGVLSKVKLGSFQLSDTSSKNEQVSQMFRAGKVGLPHQFRNGDQSVSWYSGPLLPGPGMGSSANDDIPQCSDALLCFYNDMGMFDVSHAAAWELGRLLMLRNKKASTALFLWKQEQIQTQARKSRLARNPHLQFALNSKQQDTQPLPVEVTGFLEDLNLLKHLPFLYLVPEEELLPMESLRFFQVDTLWVQRLIQGAFIIGEAPGQKEPEPAPPLKYSELTGFLLRSEVVSGYPDLQVTGYLQPLTNQDAAPPGDEAYQPVRMEKLSASVLICLFDRSIQTVDIHLKPEVLHAGMENGGFKYLRNDKGELSNTVKVMVPLDENRRITVSSPVDGNGLVEKMKQEVAKNNWNIPGITSAEFAMEMITGVENVRFTAGS